ncbi:hypothetical protein ABT010_00065 [Streptomyces sp. NPDC002668]
MPASAKPCGPRGHSPDETRELGFVLGGKGCTGGLEELVQGYGIEVE